MAAYDTYANGDTYFANRLYVSVWTEASNANKTIALNEATMRMDRLRFAGTKVDEDQALEFPRYYDELVGDETIPDEIKYACFEIALALLDDVNPDLELENLMVLSHKFDKIQTCKSGKVLQHILAGIPSATAWRYLLPYLAASSTLQLKRVT